MKPSVALLCLVCALPCVAAEPLEGLLACRALTDAPARLACFDRETAALASVPAASMAAALAPASPATVTPATVAPAIAATPAVTPAVTRAQPAPVLDAQQSFGLNSTVIAAHEESSGARPPKVSKIEARVVALALAGNGHTLFTLDNMQVWRQLESDGDVMAKLGDVATISRGLLGSFWLQLKSGRGCKVTRLH